MRQDHLVDEAALRRHERVGEPRLVFLRPRRDSVRLAATGFGEYQPITSATSPEAMALNRRIELKFTER